jgi:hypothetical protein
MREVHLEGSHTIFKYSAGFILTDTNQDDTKMEGKIEKQQKQV